MKFKGDIIITDPCYIIKDNSDDWNKCGWGKDVEAQLEELNTLGWEQYGKDSVQAKIYNDKIADASLNIKKIGHFCADMVAVFLLDEVLKYNPDFDGEVNYYVDSARIIGVGNINFFTSQVGI